ncbi:DUF6204 family protein [Kribbella sp. NPDC051586]|uniref:DUF6204 family protein n=1 Tax=Kribbella sp. NPDC051586 TaxID=3364118 RepID=UPI00379A67D4
MNELRTFRVIVRGEFADLTGEQRDRLLAEAGEHDLLLATYSATGDLSYDESLRPFTVRCQVEQPADRPDQDAVDHGLLVADELLEGRGLAYRHLRATATCLEDVKVRRPRRSAASERSTHQV